MATHEDLIAEMPQLEKMTIQERLEHTKKRRSQQLERYQQYEREIVRRTKKLSSQQKGDSSPPPPSPDQRIPLIAFAANVQLLEAAARGDTEEVEAFLKAGVDPNTGNEDGLTALYQSCIDNREDMLRVLIDNGADVNIKDREMWTPLHAASTCGHKNLAAQLITRCSGVYCKKCLRFPKRLNKQGNHDPGGQEYKVCKNCHEPKMSQVREVTELGVVRNHTKDFNRYRDEFRAYQWDIEKAHEEYRFEPTYYSILRQCRRLKEGFGQSLNFRSSVPALSIRKRPTPEWQKARTWVDANNKDVPGCQLCPRNPAKFVPGSLHNCRTCGRRVCNRDSSQDLLLYLPDAGTVNPSSPRTPECKLIRIAGCPNAEPSTHLYLRICSTCKTKLTVLQERHFTCTAVVVSEEYQCCVEAMERIHLDTKRMRENIQKRMPEFAEMVGKLASDSKNLPEAVRKALAYHQGNLIDQFPQYLATVSKLRDLSPQTDQQVKLVRYLKQEKFAFYQQSSAEFQGMVRRMMDIMPKDEIEQIKITVDTEAINCACLVLKQLAIEVLNISEKHKLSQDLAENIINVYKLCEEDLKQVLSRNPAETESWESHLETITRYVKAELQERRRLIHLDKKRENVSLEVFLRKECARKIQGIVIHIQLKSSSQSFKKSKEALERLQEEWS